MLEDLEEFMNELDTKPDNTVNNKIEIIDSIMGSGKTTGIIKWMNSHPNYKYVYITFTIRS